MHPEVEFKFSDGKRKIVRLLTSVKRYPAIANASFGRFTSRLVGFQASGLQKLKKIVVWLYASKKMHVS